ncbi:MAG TPA: hypothetical protein VFC25_02620 [Verrucomicrobiae bacterium]|nr:hypothetical protein [Verrucomicrobiae bacterium]
MTRFGPLDLLGAVGEGRDYDDLMPHAVDIPVGANSIKVIDLDTLIELKERAGRDKDAATLAILRRTRDERSKGR